MTQPTIHLRDSILTGLRNLQQFYSDDDPRCAALKSAIWLVEDTPDHDLLARYQTELRAVVIKLESIGEDMERLCKKARSTLDLLEIESAES